MPRFDFKSKPAERTHLHHPSPVLSTPSPSSPRVAHAHARVCHLPIFFYSAGGRESRIYVCIPPGFLVPRRTSNIRRDIAANCCSSSLTFPMQIRTYVRMYVRRIARTHGLCDFTGYRIANDKAKGQQVRAMPFPLFRDLRDVSCGSRRGTAVLQSPIVDERRSVSSSRRSLLRTYLPIGDKLRRGVSPEFRPP